MGDIIRLTPRVRSPRQRGQVDVELGREIATMLLLRIRTARGRATALRVALGMATAAVSLFEDEGKKVRVPHREQSFQRPPDRPELPPEAG
jgi:hypothetical protein